MSETETIKAKPYCVFCKSEDVGLFVEENIETFDSLMQIGCHKCQMDYYVDKEDFLEHFSHKHDWQYDATQGDTDLFICDICQSGALRESLPKED